MKFIHIADVHWGMNPDSGQPWSRERAQAIKSTFAEVIQKAKELDVDCILIAGDLFHRQPLARDLKEVNYLFSTIPAIRVVIIAGNHDRIRKSSALYSFSWSSNVTFFMEDTMSSVYFAEINTEISGFSYHTSEIREPLLDSVDAPDDGRIHILMAHGGDSTHLPFDKRALALSRFSYIALGHIHKPEILAERKMAYSGSPEPLDKTETGQHGMMVGEISSATRQVTSLSFVPMASVQYIPLVIDITPETTNTELAHRLRLEMQKRGSRHIYRFRIRGMRDPDITFDLDMLSCQLRVAEIIDESEPQYDFRRLFAEHPGDMIGFFIQALQKDDMSPVEKKALYHGINALLQTKDERSQT